LTIGTTWSSGLLQGTVSEKPDDESQSSETGERSSGSCSTNKVCSVAIFGNKWLDITYRGPQRWLLMVAIVLTLGTVVVVAAFVRRTDVWRRTEAELTILRDLPVGLLHVERDVLGTSIILAASDHAEELLDSRLPAFGASPAKSNGSFSVEFWNILEEYGFMETPATGATSAIDAATTRRYCPNLKKDVVAQREKGISSTYWVRHRQKQSGHNGAWLRVVGTPELRATVRTSRAVSFSLVDEVPLTESRELDDQAERCGRSLK
jgi:hypothetical protein